MNRKGAQTFTNTLGTEKGKMPRDQALIIKERAAKTPCR